MWPKIQVFTPNKGTQKSMPVRLKWSLYLTPCHTEYLLQSPQKRWQKIETPPFIFQTGNRRFSTLKVKRAKMEQKNKVRKLCQSYKLVKSCVASCSRHPGSSPYWKALKILGFFLSSIPLTFGRISQLPENAKKKSSNPLEGHFWCSRCRKGSSWCNFAVHHRVLHQVQGAAPWCLKWATRLQTKEARCKV